MLIWGLLIGLVCTPAAAWTFYKPTRVLAPEWNGVSCLSEHICTDDASRYEEARALYDEAYADVHAAVGVIEQKTTGDLLCVPSLFSIVRLQQSGRTHRRDLRHCRQPARVERLLPPS